MVFSVDVGVHQHFIGHTALCGGCDVLRHHGFRLVRFREPRRLKALAGRLGRLLETRLNGAATPAIIQTRVTARGVRVGPTASAEATTETEEPGTEGRCPDVLAAFSPVVLAVLQGSFP